RDDSPVLSDQAQIGFESLLAAFSRVQGRVAPKPFARRAENCETLHAHGKESLVRTERREGRSDHLEARIQECRVEGVVGRFGAQLGWQFNPAQAFVRPGPELCDPLEWCAEVRAGR